MVGDYEIAVAQVVEQFRVMWCGRKEEDEEVRARWRMCAGLWHFITARPSTLYLLGILGNHA